MEFLLSTNFSLGILSTLAVITSVIVELLKHFLPKSFPTKILTMIVAIIITVLYFLLFTEAITAQVIYLSIVGGFVTSFIAMYGFDSFKSIVNKYKIKEEDDSGVDE